MNLYLHKISFFLIGIFCTGFAWAADTIQIPGQLYHIDHGKKLILVNRSVQHINATWIDEKTGIVTDEYYRFQTGIMHIQRGIPYIATNEQDIPYTVYFSEIPVIEIYTGHVIVDEPKVPAQLIFSQEDHVFGSPVGIEYRGASSQMLPKKSLQVEFWEDSTGNVTKDVSLLGMRADDDWAFQAMYNEPLRLNNKISHDLWLDMHSPYYQDMEPTAICGVRMKYVEVFLNGEYRGIYGVSELVDRKQLRLKNYDGGIRGELYKGVSWGASTFTSVHPYDNGNKLWGGFEYIHPEEITDWANVYDFVDFVLNGSDSDFYDNYHLKFDMDNAVDYFIFLNLTRATDNTGKNIFVGKYQINHPYFYIPWDLDGTFGIIWNGMREDITNGLLSNGFYNRLLLDCRQQGFWEKLQQRWMSLRTSLLSHENLMNRFSEQQHYLYNNGAYAREKIAWESFGYDSTYMLYTSTWLNKRLDYLDDKFSRSCSFAGIEETPDKEKVKLYPNPARNHVYIVLPENVTSAEIEILNANGTVAAKHRQPYVIDISQMPAGFYYIKIKTEGFTEIQKLIIQ